MFDLITMESQVAELPTCYWLQIAPPPPDSSIHILSFSGFILYQHVSCIYVIISIATSSRKSLQAYIKRSIYIYFFSTMLVSWFICTGYCLGKSSTIQSSQQANFSFEYVAWQVKTIANLNYQKKANSHPHRA